MKELLDENERGEKKVGLKLNIQKTKIMTSGPITSWETDGERVETVSDFNFLRGIFITIIFTSINGYQSHNLNFSL